MNSLDLFIIVPILVGFVFGLFKGLVKELTSLAAVFLGIYGAKFFSPWLADILMKDFHFSVHTAKPFSYLLIFVAIVIGLLFTAKSLDKIFNSISLGSLNKFLGGVFGGLKYALVISVLLNVFDFVDNKVSLMNHETKENSFFFEPVRKLGPQFWDETKQYKNQVANKK